MATQKNAAGKAALSMKERQEQLKKSAIPSRKGYTKDYTINKGTKYEYTLTFSYPGVRRGGAILDNARDANGNIQQNAFMEGVIQSVIVNPHIRTLDFWDTHLGIDEVSTDAINFLIAMRDQAHISAN